MVRPRGPIRGLISENESLLISHFRRERMHGARRSVFRNMRICELDIGMS
jgi:hypothetical protein